MGELKKRRLNERIEVGKRGEKGKWLKKRRKMVKRRRRKRWLKREKRNG